MTTGSLWSTAAAEDVAPSRAATRHWQVDLVRRLEQHQRELLKPDGLASSWLRPSDQRAFLAVADECQRRLRRGPLVNRMLFCRRRATLGMLSVMAPFLVRTVESRPKVDPADPTWTPSLVGHLLARHRVPACLFTPWEDVDDTGFRGGSDAFLPYAWFVLLGQGVSPRRFGPVLGARMRPPVLERLHECPATTSWPAALLWAEVMAAGGDERIFRLLHRNEARFGSPLPVDDTVRWLVTRGADLDDETTALVLEWAGERRRQDHAFSWAGRSAAGTRARVIAWREQRLARRAQAMLTVAWPAHGWDFETSRGADCWTCRELTTGSDVADEGAAMQHCAGDYAWLCRNDDSALFSVRKNGVRAVTVHVDPCTRRVVDVRGPRNAAPSADALDVVTEWVELVLTQPPATCGRPGFHPRTDASASTPRQQLEQ